jgi:dipeptidase E
VNDSAWEQQGACSLLRIIAIGGGELGSGETILFDRHIVEAATHGEAEPPKALFIPTASNDSPAYCDAFRKVYGGELGCAIDMLLLSREFTSRSDIERKIEWADLVYVGGGNTRRMLDSWRYHEVDRSLIRAAKRGKILSGLSAGAMCWFRYGSSDAAMLEGTSLKTIPVEGLGLVDAALSPHMSTERFRWHEFAVMVSSMQTMGLALADLAAIEIRGGRYRILAACDGAEGHRLFWTGSRLHQEQLPVVRLVDRPAPTLGPRKGFRSLRELLNASATGGKA